MASQDNEHARQMCGEYPKLATLGINNSIIKIIKITILGQMKIGFT